MKLQLWIVDHKQFLFRQNYAQTILWILCKLRYFQSTTTFAKKTKEKKKEINPKFKSLQPPFSFPNGCKKVKKDEIICFSQKKTWINLIVSQDTKNYNFIKKTLLGKKFLLAELHKIPESKPLANISTGEPVCVLCTRPGTLQCSCAVTASFTHLTKTSRCTR